MPIAVGEGRVLKSIPLDAFPPEAWRPVGLAGTEPGAETPEYYYAKVPWLYRAVELIASSVGSLPYAVYQGEEPFEDVGALSWYGELNELFSVWAADWILRGAAYAIVERNRFGVIKSMRRLAPSTITPKYNEDTGELLYLERRVRGKLTQLSLDKAAYCYIPSRVAECGVGVSPARAALSAAGTLRNMDTMIERFFEAGAIRPTLAVFEQPMQEPERERVQTTLQRALTGVKKAFTLIAISKQVTLETVGEYPDRLTMPELTDAKRQDICTALGIPHTLLFANAANYATAQQDALNFYDLTVIPLAQKFCAVFNSQIFRGTEWVLKTNEAELELYQQFEATKVDALATMLNASVITVNEFRERVGLEPLADAEQPEPQPETAPPKIADEDGADEDPTTGELRTWERFALRKLKTGKPKRDFRAQYVHPVLAAALTTELELARSPDDIKSAFDTARLWSSYP